jgi:hypothetical protein
VFLFNSTALPALVHVNPDAGPPGVGIGVIGAKATFRFDSRGGCNLDTQAPFDLHADARVHPLGFLPADRLSRRGVKFEVMLLGHAYAPGGRSVGSLRAALSIGDERRVIDVFGDRHWVGLDSERPGISAPEPFARMPLTYERAFGGSFPVQFDPDTVNDVFDPINRRGRGFDARLWADSLVQLLGAPPGYPILRDYLRWLPNLESPSAPIRTPQDAPEPVGWAPAAPDIAVSQLARIRRETARARTAPPSIDAVEAESAPHPTDDPDEAIYQAHSDWVIAIPPAGARIRLDHLLPDAPTLELRLPQLRVIADYVIYGRMGERELRPTMLVLLPDERAFYIVYTSSFTFERGPAHERAFRLRTASGWYPGS